MDKIQLSLQEQLSAVCEELTKHRRQIHAHTLGSNKRDGRTYEKNVEQFVPRINQLELVYRPKLNRIGAYITRFATKQGLEQRNPQVVKLWYQWAEAFSNFSEHPAKTNASVMINADHIVEAASVNGIPANIERRGFYYVEGKSANYFVCGERQNFVEKFNLQFDPLHLSIIPLRNHMAAVRAYKAKYEADILVACATRRDVEDCIMITKVPPCEAFCCAAIGLANPLAVYSKSGTGTDFRRNVNFDEARKRLAKAGVPLIDLRMI